MKNKQNLILGLIAISLILNYLTWQELQYFQQNQQDVVRQYDMERLSNEVSTISQTAQSVLKEKQWLQNVNFVVADNVASKTDVILKGEWSLGELGKGQVPELWLRENGSNSWDKLSLKDAGGLTYNADIKVLPEKRYEYKLVAEGNVIRASEIQELPYHLYGLPTGFVDFVFFTEEEDKIIFDMHLNFDIVASDSKVKPKNSYVEIERKGSVEQKISFKADPNPDIGPLVARWKANRQFISEYKPYLVVEYENGLTKRTFIEVFEKYRFELKEKGVLD